jgi:hypothetical protein
MNYSLINFPRQIPIEVYESAIAKISELLSREKGIVSIYQIGTISNPGISDIDLIVVFQHHVPGILDPKCVLNQKERHTFTHSVFGVSIKHFQNPHLQPFFHHFKLLYGEDLLREPKHVNESEIQSLKTQIALEYLITNYIARSVERIYRVLSVRNLLMSVKALQFDLEFLGAKNSDFFRIVSQVNQWRDIWFEHSFDKPRFLQWFEDVYRGLVEFLKATLEKRQFYLPDIKQFQYTRNIKIMNHEQLHFIHRGLVLPGFLSKISRRAKKLNHFVNQFDFYFPFKKSLPEEIINQRFLFLRKMLAYHKKHFPHFSPLINNLLMKVLPN